VLSKLIEGGTFQGCGADELCFTSPWSVHGGSGSACFCCLLEGGCRIELEGDGTAAALEPGDLVISTRQHGHSLGDDRGTPTFALTPSAENGRPSLRTDGVPGGGGRPSRLIYGGFRFDPLRFGPMLAALPPLVTVKGNGGKAVAWAEDLLRLMCRECGDTRPGRQAVIDQLTRVLFIQAVRTCFAAVPDWSGTWLAALTDPEIGRALQLMHSRLDAPWTVAALADAVCLSRSVFASRFKTLVSQSPLQYLLEYRMRKAADLLVEDRCGIKEITAQVGYATRAAFSNAFKRWSGGTSPGAYKRLHQRSAGCDAPRA
jgi:AraC-like DNA-binding protein